jgi:GNAT superfamily N-acetyltransferase
VTSSALERAQAFQHGVARGVADEVRELPFGFALRTPSLPAVHGANGLWVVGLHPGLTATDLAAQADAAAGDDQPYRHVEVREEATARRLESSFRAEGWRTRHELLMLLAGEPDRVADTGAVREVPLEAIEPVERAVWRDDTAWGPGEDEVRDLVERDRRIGGVVRERCFAIVEGDDPVAFTKLLSDGAVAQVEDVGTAPHARGRGHARALVTHALAVARAEAHEVVFIAADDEDWPKELYARLGFAPAARTSAFTRR